MSRFINFLAGFAFATVLILFAYAFGAFLALLSADASVTGVYRNPQLPESHKRDWRSYYTDEHDKSCCGKRDCFQGEWFYAPEEATQDGYVRIFIAFLQDGERIMQHVNRVIEIHQLAVHDSEEPTPYICTVRGEPVKIFEDGSDNIRCLFEAIGG